jgi:drug/metabolite transporter (DMT)-like permease
VSATTRPQLAAALAVVYVVWGSTYVALKIGDEQLPPLGLSSVRFLVAGALLYAWCTRQRRRRPEAGWQAPTAAQWRAGALQGVMLPAAGTGGATWAEVRLPSGTTALLLATIPVWIVLTKRIVDRERIGALAATGLLGGSVGVAVLVDPFIGATPDPWATVVALGGALSWGVGTVIGQHAPRPAQPLLASAVEMTAAGVAMGVLSAVTGDYRSFHVDASALRSIGAVCYLVVFGSLVAYSTYEWLMHHASARIVGTYAFINPLVAVVLGWWLLGESVGPRSGLAAAIIVAGVALLVLPARRERGMPDERANGSARRPVTGTSRAAR